MTATEGATRALADHRRRPVGDRDRGRRDRAPDPVRIGDPRAAGVLRRRPWTDVTQLEFEAAALGAAPGLAVRGEVDAGTAPALDERLDGAIRESVGSFVLDLSGVDFLDSTGLRVLLRAR